MFGSAGRGRSATARAPRSMLDEEVAAAGERLAAAQQLAIESEMGAPPLDVPPSTDEGSPAAPLTCVVCFDEPVTHAMVPCGHLCICEACSDKVMAASKKCPICCQACNISMRIYTASA